MTFSTDSTVYSFIPETGNKVLVFTEKVGETTVVRYIYQFHV